LGKEDNVNRKLRLKSRHNRVNILQKSTRKHTQLQNADTCSNTGQFLEQMSKYRGVSGNTFKSARANEKTKTNNKNRVKVDVARSRIAVETAMTLCRFGLVLREKHHDETRGLG
jgi:hypothetical protein